MGGGRHGENEGEWANADEDASQMEMQTHQVHPGAQSQRLFHTLGCPSWVVKARPQGSHLASIKGPH